MNTRRLEPRVTLTAALVSAASAAVTLIWCGSMAHMPGMKMPGGWVMSMAWMRMPGQGWASAGASFIAMWALMMLAMMMPVLLPQLRGMRAGEAAGYSTGYFGVWTGLGIAIFPIGISFAELAMRSESLSRATPGLAAFILLAAGAMQFTRWKARLLACCHREETCCGDSGNEPPLRAGAALGLRCVYCCASLNAVLLVMGVMDLRAMALITMAISAERLMPALGLTSRVIGVALLGLGSVLLVRGIGA